MQALSSSFSPPTLQDSLNCKHEGELASLRHDLEKDAELARLELEGKYREEADELLRRHQELAEEKSQEQLLRVREIEEKHAQELQGI